MKRDSKPNFYRRRTSSFLHFTLCIVGLFIFGCGGGTSGTGGGGLNIAGTLRTTNNMPVQGVQVAVTTSPQGNGKLMKVSYSSAPVLDKNTSMATTDSQGMFNLSIDYRPDKFSLAFQGEVFDSMYEVKAVPGTATQLNLSLLIDPETYEINEELEQFEDDEGNEVEKH